MTTPQRTTDFVFEEIGGTSSTRCLFVLCTDGSRSIATLDDMRAFARMAYREGWDSCIETVKASRLPTQEGEG